MPSPCDHEDRPVATADVTRYAAFLRGINLGNRRIRNHELRGHFEAIAGLRDIATFLASGNVAFGLATPSGARPSIAILEETIQTHLAAALGYDVDTFVRGFADLERVVDGETAGRLLPCNGGDAWKLHVIFLKDEPEAAAAEALRELATDDDRFDVEGREGYWLRRGGLSDSKLMPADLERALGVSTSTMRTHNTVARLLAKFGESA
ncbi:MAG: DUF1697 domain-containing protein [Gemmatimonadota bacterium]|nr:DUF1697 domain-containing protein [Gemmatimonadota bacterium]